ncbi:UV radiation resistance protein/autophagy-related protein 14 [Heracleum sosnowskyi]|uniref:UV radiation resistance protein/autophagy-related protein 14 n=1 Tax=Heracleum sosnowskyi TaxID=360622 RepID=A0AAD8HPQ8_9APIA|nr:UV radiation resistance protein/autophagy-related protein 14 [Heracleum sosnowskyi]
MNRKNTSYCCALCDNTNVPSICSTCVNYRLNENYTNLKSFKARRDQLYSRLTQLLVAKGKADDQLSWRVHQHEKLATLRQKLHHRKEQLLQGKTNVKKMTYDIKVKYEVLESAMSTLEKNRKEQLEKHYPNLICTQSLGLMAISSERLHKQSVVVKQICKLFPQRRVLEGERKDGVSGQCDQICSALLPRGLDPHSVRSDDLAASLGYMVQLLNLVIHTVGAPALHNSGFAGSSSRIWQRDSYWNARPSSRSNEYPLFIPRQNFCSTGGETSWSDRSSSNFGVASMESEQKPNLDSPAYCYNTLSLEVPAEASTFEAFAKLLATLSSSKEVRSAFSMKMAGSRSHKQVQQLNKSVWNVNTPISSSTLLDSTYILPRSKNMFDKTPPSSANSFLYSAALSDSGKGENLIEGWDLVEHPTFPPPPSEIEDVEHWTRAMIIDATKYKK